MKIDRIEQTVCIKNIGPIQQIKTKEFILTPIGNNLANLKTNPGKLINKSLNLGAIPEIAELINLEIIHNLKVIPKSLNKIEYCIDVKVPFKLTKHKHILRTFYESVIHFNYKMGKIDIEFISNTSIEKTKWKGIKGYKNSRSIKLYSKYEEKKIIKDYDLIRLEITFTRRTIYQNKIKNISDIKLATKEILEILNYWEKIYLKSINQYSKKTAILINLLKKELKLVSSSYIPEREKPPSQR